jgi:hypothetical protein
MEKTEKIPVPQPPDIRVGSWCWIKHWVGFILYLPVAIASLIVGLIGVVLAGAAVLIVLAVVALLAWWIVCTLWLPILLIFIAFLLWGVLASLNQMC